MVNLNSLSILLGTKDPEKLAKFYEKVFGKPADSTEGGWYGWRFGANVYLTIGEHSKVKDKAKDPHRIIINFETEDVEKEFERIKDLGAKVVAKPYKMEGYEGMRIATFADPDGNYFQLMTPWEM